MPLKLIVNLMRPQRGAAPEIDRLPLGAETHEILGVPVRKVNIPVAAGRNLGVLLEAAVRSTILLLRGIDSTQEFVERHKQALDGADGAVN
jgi:HPr kinase/phosphorylase